MIKTFQIIIMSNKIESEKAPKAKMRGSDIIVKSLEKQGVEVVFAYPGGQSIDLHDAFSKSKKIRTILPRHEQSCGFMAQGYARTTGKVGVCMTTSGPGATNVLTAIADAYMDSVPMVILTGQVFQTFIGKSAFQETDVFGMTLPIVKHSYLVLDPNDLTRIIKEAFIVASTGRPGPVLIDIPKDVQLAQIEPDFDVEADLPGLKKVPETNEDEIDALVSMIENSKQPVIYAGGGVVSAGAAELLNEFSEITGIPVAATLMGLGCANPLENKNLYWFGMHGTYAGNSAVCNSDLLITIGARFDDRITGVVSKFATGAKIVHIDIDPAEHGKNVNVALGINSDAKNALELLVKKAKDKSFKKPDLQDWICQIIRWKSEHPYPFATPEREKFITGPAAIKALYEVAKDREPIITTGVGQHQMWTPQQYIFTKPRQFISSLGAGTMGFGLPSALGVKVANPEREVIDIDGDGSFQMNIQEMATAVMEKIPVKVMMLNNQFLGMVMQWQDMFYGGNHANTNLSINPQNIAGPANPNDIYPNYIKIAEGYGWKARRVVNKGELKDALLEMLDSKEPYLLEVVIPHDEHVLPFIPPGKSAHDIIVDCVTCGKCPRAYDPKSTIKPFAQK